MHRVLGIIPARYLSSRLPGKPLIDIGGKSMIVRVYDQCLKSNRLTDVWVATDDQRIYDEVSRQGGKALLTQSNLLSGTDRCFDAYRLLTEQGETYDMLVNIQGDEPFINPRQIDLLVSVLAESEQPIATLIKKITDVHDLSNHHVVKVACSIHDTALYFSRQPIPYMQQVPPQDWLVRHAYYKHIGIYAFQSSIIPAIKQLHPTPLEKAESLEQLRWIESGLSIRVAITQFDTLSIDTPDDLETARNMLRMNS
ncbi:MAG: 3-deoxy-manno-octulosonate cytidylyltransferase [Candidatus Competibacteraceae bacterium]|nr:3-deoxy-manno-octulosonate cytidylyltransferase [Candidatus Competibacteraceae bacterium]